jgi:hypothetical protein
VALQALPARMVLPAPVEHQVHRALLEQAAQTVLTAQTELVALAALLVQVEQAVRTEVAALPA